VAGASGIERYDLRTRLLEVVCSFGDALSWADEVGVEVTSEHEAKVILNVNAFFIQSRMRC
jgi:hypothetical protein